MGHFIYGPRREKTCLRGVANNTGAYQPTHPRSLISAFVICILKSIISKLATSEFSVFWLVSVAEETGLTLALSETPKTDFLASWPKLFCVLLLTVWAIFQKSVFEKHSRPRSIFHMRSAAVPPL